MLVIRNPAKLCITENIHVPFLQDLMFCFYNNARLALHYDDIISFSSIVSAVTLSTRKGCKT